MLSLLPIQAAKTCEIESGYRVWAKPLSKTETSHFLLPACAKNGASTERVSLEK